jgi:uncharacterized protein (TIRG00374 family)
MESRLNLRKSLGTLAGVLISAGFLALALYRVDFTAVGAALASADYRWVLASGAFTLLGYVCRTARWRRLLAPAKSVPIRRLFPVLVVGFAANNLFPGRPGEFARAYAVGEREGLPKTLGFATVVVERVTDGLTLIVVLALAALAFDLPGWGKQAEGFALTLFGIALAGLLFLLWREELATRVFRAVIRFLPGKIRDRLTRMLESFILGLHSLRSAPAALAVALWSLAVWTCEASSYFMVLTGFGIADAGTRAVIAAFVMVIVNLGVMIPAAPGGLGPFEAAATLALSAFSVGKETAVSVALVSHAIQFLLITGLGALFIAREGIRLTQAVEVETD